MSFASFFSLALATLATATPSPRSPQLLKIDGETTGNYIVQLKSNVDMHEVMGAMSDLHILREFKNLNGFAVEGNEKTLETLLANPDVDIVEEDAVFHNAALITQQATWGIARLSHDGPIPGGNVSFTYPYTYDESAGEGVDIYVIDSGIYLEHNEFEGRAKWGATFGGYNNNDELGHGTHVAGIAGSREYGVAKKATLYAVRVLDAAGSGTTNDVVSGMDWALSAAIESGRPSVVSMSIIGPASIVTDRAVKALTDAGVHVVVAAGNQSQDAYLFSPARAPTANTVAATDVQDYWSGFSNLGKSVDIWAPGVSIVSCGISDPDAWIFKTGTSMSTPHISGLIATFISSEGNLSPEAMSQKLKDRSQKGFVNDIPNAYGGTLNLFAHNM